MIMEFLQLLSVILISVLPEQAVLADVAPPNEIGSLSMGIILGLAFLSIVIVLISVFVIRMIKKNHTNED